LLESCSLWLFKYNKCLHPPDMKITRQLSCKPRLSTCAKEHAYLLWLLFLISPFILHAGSGLPPDRATKALSEYTFAYPQQKVFIHTDRDVYFEGESVWFQAYVVNAFGLMPDTLSKVLYVEFTDQAGEHIAYLSTRLDQGVTHGSILLPDSLPEGNYQIRAYTNWMRNFSEDDFYSRQIYVHNPAEKNYIRRRDIRRNRRFNRELEKQQETLELLVFPEGGNLVSGLENRVAYRLSNLLGAGVHARLFLGNEAGEELLSVETYSHGMGYFSFVPEEGRQYHLRAVSEYGTELSHDLPLPQRQSYLLRAEMDEEWLEALVEINFRPSDLGLPDRGHVLLQSHGQLQHLQPVSFEKGLYRFQIPLETLPDGICQLTLFDGNNLPVAERLVFVNRGEQAEVSVELDTALAEVPAVDATDESGQTQTLPGISVGLTFDSLASGGSYSMAVLSGRGEGAPGRESIAMYMLLSSELGPLPDIWDEDLFDGSREKAALIDLVMMTHGWRRFDWSTILSGRFPVLDHPFLDGLTISGKLTALSSSRVPNNVKVELAIQNEKTDRYFTETDDRGNFSFSGLYYYGMREARLRTPDAMNGRNLWIDIDSRKLTKVPFEAHLQTRPRSILERGSDWQRISRPSLHLTQISIRPPSQQSRIFSKPDQIIYGRDVEGRYNRMYELLVDQVFGLMQDERGLLYFRGKTSFRGNIEPLFIVNGVPGHKNSFLMVRPREIERLEVYRGTSAAIYGSRGANGALSVYTRTGDETSRYLYEFVFLGYHAPRIFSPSNVSAARYREVNEPMTLHWEPGIHPDSNGRAEIIFPQREKEEMVWVIIQGIDANGRITCSMQHLAYPVSD
jgi:hypothetical protein